MNYESSPSTISTQQTNTINLLDLPAELLLETFKTCGKFESPICKSLLYYTRAPVFRHIRIKSIESFKRFIQTILTNHSVGSLVKYLFVKIEDKSEEYSPGIEPQQVLKVLEQLTQLEILEIDWEWLSIIVCSNPASYASLPKMYDLTLVDPFRSQPHPWSQYHFQNLYRYEKLIYFTLKSRAPVDLDPTSIELAGTFMDDSTLDIDSEQSVELFKAQKVEELEETLLQLSIDSDSDSDSTESNSSSEKSSSSSSSDNNSSFNISEIEMLDICTNSLDLDLINTTLEFFSVFTLRISDSLVGQNFLKLLEEMYPLILGLHIYEDVTGIFGSYPLPIVSIYPLITRFTDLEELTISARVFTPELFQYIRDPLPLQCLTFGFDADVKVSDIKKLLQPGPAKLSALKILTLDNIWGQVSGTRVAEAGPYYDEAEDQYTPHPDYSFPAWTDEFSVDSLQELIEFSKTCAVAIEGNVLEALIVEATWIEESDLADDLGEVIRESEMPDSDFGSELDLDSDE